MNFWKSLAEMEEEDKMSLIQWVRWKIHQLKGFSIRFRICDMIRGENHMLMYAMVTCRTELANICYRDITDRETIYNMLHMIIHMLHHVECGGHGIDFKRKYTVRFKLINLIYHGLLSYIFNRYINRFDCILTEIKDDNHEYNINYLKDMCACLIDEINLILYNNGGNLHG